MTDRPANAYWCEEHQRYETPGPKKWEEVKTMTRLEPVQKRAEARLEDLRRAARQLYNDPNVGRDRLTTQMVAELAGASIGTVYRYYVDRIAILDDIAPDRDQSPVHA